MPLEELTQRIADRGASVSGEDSQATAVALYHRHLPKLVDADIVDIDAGRHMVKEGDSFAIADSVLEEVTSCQ